MSEYPKVTDVSNGSGITGIQVQYSNRWLDCNRIQLANARALLAVLTEKVAEMDAKRFQVVIPNGESYACWVQGPDGVAMAFRFGTPEQNKADAEEYAAKLNAREGLA